ncbi:winged helix-turn-helix domain-containing protein [Maritalea mediterranea]|uniref:Transcriptional regulator n=1 Tax=Maritalea mediterranea TaxID=2909667 RepID=A0ABS9E7J3_9HYPH|nr:transcriptional regulator [Maritalea mediterranea]MCF4097874.1 transcriptional regulator [Maritalea mediterranea]
MTGIKPDAINEVIHGRIRLGIMAYLASQPKASFAELVKALETSHGNLSVHLKKLETAGYIEISKRFVEGKPLTTAEMTQSGHAAWRAYLGTLASLFDPSPR